MRNIFERIGAGPALHGTASTVSKVLGLALLLLYGRVLPPADFGVLVLLYLTTYLLDALAVQGLTAKVLRQQGLEHDEATRRTVVTTAFLHTLACAGVLLGVTALAAEPLSVLFLGDRRWGPLLQLLCVAGIFRAAQNVPRQMLRARGRQRALDILKLADALMAATLNGVLVIGLDLGLRGVVYAEVLREIFFALVLATTLRRDLSRSGSTSALHALLRDGLPRLRRELPAMVLTANDRYFLAFWGSLVHLGTYGFALRLAHVLVDFVVQPLLGLVSALRRDDHSPDGDSRVVLGRFLTYFVALSGLAALAIAVFTPSLLRIVCHPEYEGAAWVLPLLLIALLIAGVQKLLLAGLHLDNQVPIYVRRATAAATLLSLAGNSLFVPRHGALGAAFTAVLAQALLCGTAIVAARRQTVLCFEPSRLAKVVSALLCSFYIAGFVMPENLIGQIAAAWAMVLLYPALLGVFGFYTVTEIDRLRDLLNHRIVPAKAPVASATAPIPATSAETSDELVGAGASRDD